MRGTRTAVSLKPNDWGLFDMLGNAYEWTNNPYGDYPNLLQRTLGFTVDSLDETPVADNQSRVLRGGSFLYPASTGRSAPRFSFGPSLRSVTNGFRLARTLPPCPPYAFTSYRRRRSKLEI